VIESFEDPTRMWEVVDPGVPRTSSLQSFRSRLSSADPHSGDSRRSLDLDFHRAYQSVRFMPMSGFAVKPLPALANAALLATADVAVGDVIDVWVHSSTAIPFEIAGTVNYFPTMYEGDAQPNGGTNAGYVILPRDAVLARINTRTPNAINSNEVWLEADGQVVAAELATAIPTVTQIWETEDVRLALKASPMALGLRSTTLFGYVLTGLLSLIGFATYCYMSTRQRETYYGVLRSMGLSASQLYGSLIVEQVILIVAGLAFGTLLGLLLNQLVLPGLPLGLGDRPPVPPFFPRDDWAAVVRLYVMLMFAFLVALGVATALLVRAKTHRALRIGQE
jgi:ABC-type antimicrobial peptide transport system permease subunit